MQKKNTNPHGNRSDAHEDDKLIIFFMGPYHYLFIYSFFILQALSVLMYCFSKWYSYIVKYKEFKTTKINILKVKEKSM